MAKKRLDVLLVERGLAETREKAQALILAGEVKVDGRPIAKAGALVAEGSELAVSQRLRYVSRGGLKIEHALAAFAVDPREKTAADIGASTGGFTDCLLQQGARKVYAVDVGYGQLDWRLRTDPRVETLERTNVRYLQGLPEPVDLVTIDVSFISLRLVLPVVWGLLTPDGLVVALVKPQFEAGREQVGKGGVVRDPSVHREVLKHLIGWATDQGWVVRGATSSPIRGPAGNREFFVLLAKEGIGIEESDVEAVVNKNETVMAGR